MEQLSLSDTDKDNRYSILVGDQESLVILGQHGCIVVRENNSTNLAYNIEFNLDKTGAYALWDGNLYYGYDWGEFGGGLRKLDLSNGQWSEINNDPQIRHVSDLCLSPDGNLMITGGNDMVRIYGKISELSTDGLGDKLYVSSFEESDIQWEYDFTKFLNLRYNTARNPILLTADLGLLIERDGKWRRLTTSWPDGFSATSFLMLSEHECLLGTVRDGVVFVDLVRDSEVNIRLASSFVFWKGAK
jgi:hypothetical protein